MTDLLTELNALKRPRLLINAARLGMAEYKRDTHLSRHLGARAPRDAGTILRQLMAVEATLNQERESCAASYSAARHVEVMIAIMNEAQHMRQTKAADKASHLTPL